MKSRLRQRTRTRISMKAKYVLAGSAFLGLFVFGISMVYLNTGVTEEVKASTGETFNSGSFLVNMGVVPQTYGNGMKPYGMIYELVTQYNVPVKWVIEPSKAADGIDFSHNSVDYKGGTFIIPSYYISTAVAARIAYWQTQGVVGNYSVSSITVPVYQTITGFPNVIIDNLFSAQDTVIHYFDNAGIPSTAYGIGKPADVNSCIDLWLNPHGEPNWTTHQYLYNFSTVQKSHIWSQCHAVSMLESCRKSTAPFTQLNFLSTAGLQCWKNAKCGHITEVHAIPIPSPITYNYPADPIMQFMGAMDGTAPGGSEKWYVPATASGWRSTTKLLVTAGSNPSPGEGVILAYGYAFGDTTNGMVMYESGHDLDETAPVAGRVSAQRAFLNFYLMAGFTKTPVAAAVQISGSLNGGMWDTLEVSVSGGTPPYTYQWSSSLGGVITSPNSAQTLFAAPWVNSPEVTIVTCVVTDACNRRTFFTQPVFLNVSPLPISLLSFVGKVKDEKSVQLDWITGTEVNNDYFTIERSGDGYDFLPLLKITSKGNSVTPKAYTVNDKEPLTGVSYYRLLQTDLNGTVRTCGQVKVERQIKQAGNLISAAPNPFTDFFNVRCNADIPGPASLKIWNSSGSEVAVQQISLQAGPNTIPFSGLGDLKAGIYFVRLEHANGLSEPVKLIKR